MKDRFSGQTMKEFVGLRAKTYSQLKDNNYEDKKAKTKKKVLHKKKLKFKDYKNCLKAAKMENKISHLEENKIVVGSLKEDEKRFVKNNKLILKNTAKI